MRTVDGKIQFDLLLERLVSLLLLKCITLQGFSKF